MEFLLQGNNLRDMAKKLVLDYMKATVECASSAEGVKQARIFHECGFDWGGYPNSTSSNQQYWVVALLRELEKEEKVCRDPATKKWRLK